MGKPTSILEGANWPIPKLPPSIKPELLLTLVTSKFNVVAFIDAESDKFSLIMSLKESKNSNPLFTTSPALTVGLPLPGALVPKIPLTGIYPMSKSLVVLIK